MTACAVIVEGSINVTDFAVNCQVQNFNPQKEAVVSTS